MCSSEPAIKRGHEFELYYPTMDGRIIEYDIDSIIYEENSKYQNVRIAHSKTFGNMLILDGDPSKNWSYSLWMKFASISSVR